MYCGNIFFKVVFFNVVLCKGFDLFIMFIIKDRVRNGLFRIVGKVGYCEFFYLVFLLIVEFNKLRLCYDECFFNCWIKDFFFKLDYIMDLICYVGLNYM